MNKNIAQPDLLTQPAWPDPNPTRPDIGSGRVEVRLTRGVGRVGLALPGRVLGYPTGAGFIFIRVYLRDLDVIYAVLYALSPWILEII